TGASIAAMAASPDGRMVVALRVPAALADTTAARLVLIDAATGRESRIIEAPVLGVGWARPGYGQLRFSVDGRRLAAAGLVRDGGAVNGYHRAVGVWDVESGTPVHSWRERVEVTGAFAMLNSLPALPPLDLDMLAVRFDEGGRLLAGLVR